MAVEFFLDKNYDGIFDEDDEIIENAKVSINRRETDVSDSNGYARYIGSSNNDYENIFLNTDTLENPFLVPGSEGFSTVLRPGTFTTMDFPVIETGLIDGIVEGPNGPLAGVRMELLKDDEVIETTTTAFDGFYTFEYIKPADYIVRIDPSYEQVNIPPRHVSVTSENLFLSNVGFQISGQAADEDACTVEDSEGRVTQKCQSCTVQAGMERPAHTYSVVNPDLPTVINLRFESRKSHLSMMLDYDGIPNAYEIIQTKNNKEISIILSKTNWGVKKLWENKTPRVLEKYKVESLPNGDTRIILMAVDTIKVKKSEKLKPDEKHCHRIHFDLIK